MTSLAGMRDNRSLSTYHPGSTLRHETNRQRKQIVRVRDQRRHRPAVCREAARRSAWRSPRWHDWRRRWQWSSLAMTVRGNVRRVWATLHRARRPRRAATWRCRERDVRRRIIGDGADRRLEIGIALGRGSGRGGGGHRHSSNDGADLTGWCFDRPPRRSNARSRRVGIPLYRTEPLRITVPKWVRQHEVSSSPLPSALRVLRFHVLARHGAGGCCSYGGTCPTHSIGRGSARAGSTGAPYTVPAPPCQRAGSRFPAAHDVAGCGESKPSAPRGAGTGPAGSSPPQRRIGAG